MPGKSRIHLVISQIYRCHAATDRLRGGFEMERKLQELTEHSNNEFLAKGEFFRYGFTATPNISKCAPPNKGPDPKNALGGSCFEK
jgi:hypothetical protein